MPNITISLDDEIYRRCCVRAQMSGRSVEEIVATWLTDWARPAISEEEQARRKQEYYQLLDRIHADAKARGEVFRAADNLPREQLYDRATLR